jgi:hypothetical protein
MKRRVLACVLLCILRPMLGQFRAAPWDQKRLISFVLTVLMARTKASGVIGSSLPPPWPQPPQQPPPWPPPLSPSAALHHPAQQPSPTPSASSSPISPPAPPSSPPHEPPPTCPSSLADCASGRVHVWATAASASPPPKDAAAANVSALLGPPTYAIPPGATCLPTPPTAPDLRAELWSLASGDAAAATPARTLLSLDFGGGLFTVRVGGWVDGRVVHS